MLGERAADLSDGGEGRTRRLLAAAEAGLAAGLPSQVAGSYSDCSNTSVTVR